MDNQTNVLDVVYNKFKSDEEQTIIAKKELYCDCEGYINAVAFEEFSLNLRHKNTDENISYCLVCVNVDLRRSNRKSYQEGNKALSRFTEKISDFYWFRIGGEKFNIIAEKKDVSKLKDILEEESEGYIVYYGLVKDDYIIECREDIRKYVEKGIAEMYRKKSEIKKEIMKTNIPAEFEETLERKYLQTTYYFEGTISATQPMFKENRIWVFPTTILPAKSSIPILVVIYDNVRGYQHYYGNQIEFGFAGGGYSITARYTNEGNFNVLLIPMKNDGDGYIKWTKKSEGRYAPKWNEKEEMKNFEFCVGKITEENSQVFPLRQNKNGFFDFVKLSRKDNIYHEHEDDTKIELFKESLIEIENKKYGLMIDETAIELIAI